MKYRNIRLTVIVACATVLLCAACSDEWNDHYNGNDTSIAKSGTLWGAISSQGNLSNFTRVVKACGYDAVLNGSQTFTVFAPTDDQFQAGQADSLIEVFNAQKARGVKSDDNTVVKQFLQNHICLFKHPVSSLTDTTIVMMNGKYAKLSPDRIDQRTFLSKNELYGNGVLYTINNKVDYFPNVFEYLGLDQELDSVYQFLNSYSIYEFDETKSVPGDIINGRTEYLDSVTSLTNELFRALGRINSEDSTYWMVAPTNDEWTKLSTTYTDYFNYHKNVAKRDSMQFANARLAILAGTIFSRTENPDPAFRDSAISTTAVHHSTRTIMKLDPYYVFYHPFEKGNIFDVQEQVTCSNGEVLKAPVLNVDPRNTFMQTIKVEAENVLNQDTIQDAEEPLTVRHVAVENPFRDKISGNAFVEVVPKPASMNPTVRFSIPNVLSNVKYDVYCVFAPVAAFDTLATHEQRLPNSFRV
ncbi:MAG: fasciclin domain-containing protein, partial [Prevotella sp.]|nr:fasciclin domain-containing protein [Prevotella sp.]